METMEWFIHRQNLIHYRKKLAEATDDAQRNALVKLIAAEEAKYTEVPNDPPDRGDGQPLCRSGPRR